MTKPIKNSSKVQPRRKQIMLSSNEWTELQYRVKSLHFICYPGVAEELQKKFETDFSYRS